MMSSASHIQSCPLTQNFRRMLMNKKIIIIFFATVVFQIFAVSFLFIKTASIKRYAVKNNYIARISCTAYDPFNPLKGRYVQLTLNKEDVKQAELQTGISFKNIYRKANEYYLPEEYALSVDAMGNRNFNELNPVLELYVGKDGSVVQKGLYVNYNGKEMPIEQYIKNYRISTAIGQ